MDTRLIFDRTEATSTCLSARVPCGKVQMNTLIGGNRMPVSMKIGDYEVPWGRQRDRVGSSE